jgi:hypothetical protein
MTAAHLARLIDEVEITLPLPGKSLHSHAKGHWRAKSGATAQARREATWATKAAWSGDAWTRATVDYFFAVPDRRRRDAANLVAACKAYVDGVIDAGLLPDDCWEMLSIGEVSVEIDRERPRVVLVFRRVE